MIDTKTKTKKEIEAKMAERTQFYIYCILIGLSSVVIFLNLKYLYVTDMNTHYVQITGVQYDGNVARKMAYISRCVTVIGEIIALFVLLITKVNIISLFMSLFFIFIGVFPLFFDFLFY